MHVHGYHVCRLAIIEQVVLVLYKKCCEGADGGGFRVWVAGQEPRPADLILFVMQTISTSPFITLQFSYPMHLHSHLRLRLLTLLI
jgi:hypothetical protein